MAPLRKSMLGNHAAVIAETAPASPSAPETLNIMRYRMTVPSETPMP